MKPFSSFSCLSVAFSCLLFSCEKKQQAEVWKDTAFVQEYHEAYPVAPAPGAGEVRSIALDAQQNVWIATAAGAFKKAKNSSTWESLLSEKDNGPAYAVEVDQKSTVWLGSWNGLFRIANQKVEKVNDVVGPLSKLCVTGDTVYALGPEGFWIGGEQGFKKVEAKLPKGIRDVVSDRKGGLWLATDVGLYHWTEKETRHYYRTTDLISGYANGLGWDKDGNLWVGGLGGVTVRDGEERKRMIKPADGIPSVYVTSVSSAPDHTMWVGTRAGVVRYYPDGKHSLRFSRRWLLDDHVNDVAFDKNGDAWVATSGGVSAIRKKNITLAQKNDYFFDVLLKRHIRSPWIAGQCYLETRGDTTRWRPEDDDNDGEYTGNYLAMESFRYAATKSPEAKLNAQKAFGFLKLLQEITGTDGFFARTIIPVNWTEMHDTNRTYTDRERADELVKEPRNKPVEIRWRKSADGKWLWKGDTSSDEMCGHMFGYYFYYTLVADDAEKKVIAAHVSRIVDHLIKNNYNLIDVDGTATRWSVWSPDNLNRDPEWMPDRNQNSMEMLAFLKLAHHMTGKDKYQQEYQRLIHKEGYLKNMSEVTNQNPAWIIYFDLVLQSYLYPIFLKCEKDPELLQFYRTHLERWYEQRKGDNNPLINFIYCYSADKTAGLKASVDFLQDTPLDLVDWPINHRKREDIKIVRNPVLEDEQVSVMQPASLRMTVRWDKNPWAVDGADPHREREPVFWLLPYWMGRYLKMIE